MNVYNWFFFIMTVVVGTGLLVFYSHKKSSSFKGLYVEVLRDIGVALIVAAVVALGFEVYERARMRYENEDTIIDARMSEQLTKDVWTDIKTQVLQKDVLRTDAQIRLQLQRIAGLGPDQAEAAVEVSYKICNLNASEREFTFEHALDYQLWNAALKLPRWEHVTVKGDGTQLDRNEQDLEPYNRAGVLPFSIKLQKRGGQPVWLMTKRRNIIHAPGSYNLYMTEYTKGLHLTLEKALDNIDVEVQVRPKGNQQDLRKVGNNWFTDGLILPGQAVEIKFLSPNAPHKVVNDTGKPQVPVLRSPAT